MTASDAGTTLGFQYPIFRIDELDGRCSSGRVSHMLFQYPLFRIDELDQFLADRVYQ